jgi:CBS domain-containing protein
MLAKSAHSRWPMSGLCGPTGSRASEELGQDSGQCLQRKGVAMRTKEILRVKGNALFTIAPDGTLPEAIDSLVENDIGSLVVMDHGKLAGMLSFREVLRAVNDGEHGAAHRAVSEVMVIDPPIVGPDVEMDDLSRLMIEKRCRYVPVMDGNVLVGVLSFHDVAKALLEEQTFENRMLKGYIKNWPDE